MTHLTHNSSTAHINPAKGFRIHLLVFLLVTPVIWALWYFTGRTYNWALWQTASWAVGILFHYLGVFVFAKQKNK